MAARRRSNPLRNGTILKAPFTNCGAIALAIDMLALAALQMPPRRPSRRPSPIGAGGEAHRHGADHIGRPAKARRQRQGVEIPAPRDATRDPAEAPTARPPHRIRIGSTRASGAGRADRNGQLVATRRNADFGAVEARASPRRQRGSPAARWSTDKPACRAWCAAAPAAAGHPVPSGVGLITRPVTFNISCPLASRWRSMCVVTSASGLAPAAAKPSRTFHASGAKNQKAAASAATTRMTTSRTVISGLRAALPVIVVGAWETD